MIGGVAWVDVAIFAVLALTAYKGYTKGLIGELAGVVAMIAGIVAPWYYNGILDEPIAQATKLALPIAHVAAMAMTGIAAYVITLVVASILKGFAKLPVLGLGNAIAGAAIGLIKGSVAIWIVLFVALFFPLTKPIRASLHQSQLAPYFVEYDGAIDEALLATVPVFVRPWLVPLFKNHHV
jgi:membrane protein required for colicin V production